MIKLAKVISNAGICSRRDAEKLIINNNVRVNGILTNSPAIRVSYDVEIEVLGRIIKNIVKTRLLLYHKPVGLINTHKDPYHRKTIFDTLKGIPRVISIGRLDMRSEGLLLLTNNGDLARKFELPSNKIKRIYRVNAYGSSDLLLKNITKSINIDNVIYNVRSIKLINSINLNSWFEVILEEGKNREIRKIFSFFGLKVIRLIRLSYGPFTLGSLKPGELFEIDINTNKYKFL